MTGGDRMARVQRAGASAGIGVSLLLHAIGYLLASWISTVPDLGLELRLPDEIDFGVAEVAPAADPPAPLPIPEPSPAAAADDAPAAPPPPPEAVEPVDAGTEMPDAGEDAADAGPQDAGDQDASEPTDAGADASSDAAPDATADAGPDVASADAGTPLLAAVAPEGAQLALRLHMGRVRASPLAADVRALLEVVPDWQALVEGSGIDPIDDLERLYLASPNLKRASLVVAGQYVGNSDVPRRAVENLARNAGRSATWTRHGVFDVAPWDNRDQTPRIVALIGQDLFAITRPDDLPRVVQVAEMLAERIRAADGGVVDAADALLALRDGETLALSVEGARAFVSGMRPGQRGVPERLDVSVVEQADGTIAVTARGLFDDPEQAEEARVFWQRTRDRFAAHPLLAFIGMQAPLANAALAIDDRSLVVRSVLSEQQARVLLGFVADAARPPPGAGPVPARTPAPATPTPAGPAHQ